MARVKLFTATPCGYCRRAKELLARHGIAFDEVDITGDDAAREALALRSGLRTVPQIFFDNRPIGGYAQLKLLDAQGELVATLGGVTEPA